MALDEKTWQAHRLAIEGKVFYYNELAEPKWVEKYFPRTEGNPNYAGDPHLSFPVSSDVLNRLASLVFKDMVLTVDPPSLQVWLDMPIARNGGTSIARDIIVKALYGGTYLVTLVGTEIGVVYDTWTGEWTIIEDGALGGRPMIGYQYKVVNGKRVPILGNPEKDPSVFTVWLTDTTRGAAENVHNFGFVPGVMFYNIDIEDETPYPNPYHIRYRDPLIEYDRLYSKVLKDVRILEAVWTTNKEREDPNNLLRMNPDTINYLGENGELKQAMTNYDITAKQFLLNSLKNHIATSAQVPDFMTGLQGVGKVESGVARSIVNAPLTEVTNRIRNDFKPPLLELFSKTLAAEYAIHNNGNKPPQFKIDIEFSKNIIPVDKKEELDLIDLALRMGTITTEEAAPKVRGLLDIEEIENAANPLTTD